MSKTTSTAAILTLLIISIWCGYSIGEHNTTMNNITITKQQVISDLKIQTKAIKLIDSGETKRLKNMLIYSAKSNLNDIDTLNKLEKESKIFDAFFPKSDTYSTWIKNIKNENTKDEQSLRKVIESYSDHQ